MLHIPEYKAVWEERSAEAAAQAAAALVPAPPGGAAPAGQPAPLQLLPSQLAIAGEVLVGAFPRRRACPTAGHDGSAPWRLQCALGRLLQRAVSLSRLQCERDDTHCVMLQARSVLSTACKIGRSVGSGC